MNFFKKHLLYAGLEKDEIMPLLPEALEENGRFVRIYSMMTVGLFLICLLVSFLAGGQLAVNRYIYLAMVLINAAIMGFSWFYLPRHPRRTVVLSLLYILGMYAYSFSVSLVHSSMPATAAVAILLLMPALFDYRPIYMIGLTVLGILTHFLLALRIKPRDIAMLDLWNSLFFGAIAVLLSVYLMRVKFRLLLQKRTNRIQGETDLLTGAKNSNCFERKRRQYIERCRESVTCVFVDVNGLHELNDAKGHEAGDIMLKTVAGIVMEYFSQKDTYRIGGDEFVCFSMDAGRDAVRSRIAEIIRRVEEAGYSVSVGAALQVKEEAEMDSLVKEAELYMYKEKRKYYETSGNDRRRRVMQQTSG